MLRTIALGEQARLPEPRQILCLIVCCLICRRRNTPMMVLKCASSPPQPRAKPKSQIFTYGGMCADSSVLSSFRSLHGRAGQPRNTVKLTVLMHAVLQRAPITAYVPYSSSVATGLARRRFPTFIMSSAVDGALT